MWLDELVQQISVQADTRAYDIVEKKNRQVAQSANMLGLSFQKAFGILGTYFGVKALVKYADEWKNIDSILRLVTDNDQQRANIQKELFGITQRTRQEMSGTVDLYRKITVATEKLGVSEADRLKTTETINKALLIGGGSRTSQMAALIQLGQGLGADSLRGQELNSVLEQAPRLAKALADGLGLQVGQLRKYAENNGGIKAQQVMTAILSQASKVNNEFKNVNLTAGQALTVFNNSIGLVVSRVDKALGITDSIAKTFLAISDILDRSATAIAVIIKYVKQLFILLVAIKALQFLAIPFDLFLLNMAESVSIATALKEVLAAMNIKGLIAASWALLGPWIKLLGIAIALKEFFDTLQGKDTILRDASESLGENYNNRMANSYGEILDTFGNGWGGALASAVATPALMAYNGGAVAMDKFKQTQNTSNNSIVNNITQNITTSQPQTAADMMLDGLSRFNKGG